MTTRRRVLIQLSAATLAACTGTEPLGKGTAPGDDTGGEGDDTASGVDTGDADTGGVDTGDTGDIAEWTDFCEDGTSPLPADCARPTPFASEGPFLRPDVPERSELNVRGEDGQVLILTGRILDASCTPVEGAAITIWMAGGDARFYDVDSEDAQLYGKQTTGADGTYCFSTLRPVPYGEAGNELAAHIHVACIKDGRRVLTTQIYFEGDPFLGDQPIPPELVVSPVPQADGSELVPFDFVLPADLPQ